MVQEDFLQYRGINRSGRKEQLVLNVYSAYNLELPKVFQDPQEEHLELLRDQSSKLNLEGGLVKLPNPCTLVDGWLKAPSYLPNTTQGDVEEYLKNNNAGKAFRSGQSLLASKHLDNIMSHNISNNIRFCFVHGVCLPEQKLSNEYYNVRVCLHKDTAKVVCADCSCVAGCVKIYLMTLFCITFNCLYHTYTPLL